MPDILEGQYIVSADRSRVLARFCVSVNLKHGNHFSWWTTALTQSIYQNQPSDRAVEVIHHAIEIDYQAGDIVIWRYVGDAPHTAFDDLSMFEKV